MACYKQRGFTAIELMLVISLIGILVAISVPFYSSIVENSNYKAAARSISSVLREARALSISHNLEQRIKFNPISGTYVLQTGNRASNTSDDDWTTSLKVHTIAPGVNLRANKACDGESVTYVSFNPNGSSNSQYLCVLDADTSLSLNSRKKFLVGVASATTGRVKISSWNKSSSAWND